MLKHLRPAKLLLGTSAKRFQWASNVTWPSMFWAHRNSVSLGPVADFVSATFHAEHGIRRCRSLFFGFMSTGICST